MKNKQIKTKMAAVALSTMMITSIITYPGVIQPVSAINTPTSTNAVADVTFTVGIENDVNGVVTNIPCVFKVTKPASNGEKGEVQVGNGVNSAIDFVTTRTITIPEMVRNGTDEYTVTSIGNYAFVNCASLQNTGLESNSTVRSIGQLAFHGCTNLQSTGLENNSIVTSIGDRAFWACISLVSTGLESNGTVTSVGNDAFLVCENLKSTGLESNSTVTSIGDNAFGICTSLKSTGLESNKTVTSIGDDAFVNCASLKSTGLESNSTVTSIGDSVFWGCTSLKSTGLERNSTVTSIGDDAFHGCTSLQSTGLESNKTVKSIGGSAFIDCTSLKSTGLESNKTVTSIGDRAFGICTSLKSTGLENNKTVTSIGDYAFGYCTGLEKVSFKITTLPTMDNSEGGIFAGTNASVYYLPETTNPEQLDNCGAKSVTTFALDSIIVKQKPKDMYIPGKNFDPSGLILTLIYNDGITEEVSYNDTTKANFSFDKTLLAVGDKEVKITYLGKEVSLPITMQEKVKTNDSTSDINGIVLSLLVTGILGVVLIKRKRDIVE